MSDPNLWLEQITSEQSLAWVRAHNRATLAEYSDGQEFLGLEASLLEVLDTDDRIPFATMRGQWLYNFWRDGAHPRGLWRRTTLEQYRSDNPEWDVLLDVDALAAGEGENWVWAGADVLRPAQSLALISLSRGGADAAVVREFDLETREFRTGPQAFELPEAKSGIGWITADEVFVETDFGPGSLTDSGYPRISKRWRRGTPIDQAATVFEGQPSDVSVGASHDDTEGFERSFVSRGIDFYHSERFELAADGGLTLIDAPQDAGIGVHRQWLTILLRSDWQPSPGVSYRTGTLLAADYGGFQEGARAFTVLFEPDEHSSLEQMVWLRDHLVLVTLRDVRTSMEVLTPGPCEWARTPVEGLPALDTATVVAADPRESNCLFVAASGFTEPTTLFYGDAPGALEPMKAAPAFFDASDIEVAQHFAVSDDGTRVPYFLVGAKGRTGPAPTLLYGYGGFESSMLPAYSGVLGRAWLAKGGVYAVANIRGGGEFGPAWHTQAVRAGRHLVYEDFASVAADLVERGVTTRPQLGAQGGSNGGLLMGVMLTRFPHLFGALVCSVPLLDMRRYHLLLAGASWMAEYGDPDNPGDWAFMEPWSPYQNAEPTTVLPPVLFTTSTRDDRVHPGHARKMMARLEEQGRDGIWYYENIEGGHGGAADNKQAAFKSALTYTFLWRHLAG